MEDKFTATAAHTSPYEILGIRPDSTREQVRAAYRDLARNYHPDSSGNSENREVAEMFLLVQQAYEILSDEKKRKKYDAVRKILDERPDDTETDHIISPWGGPMIGSIRASGAQNFCASSITFIYGVRASGARSGSGFFIP